jgi:hypothetical protein
MTTNTIKFYNVGPIPLYPSELAVLDQNTGLAAYLPANSVVTEIQFKLASTTPLTADAMVKLGVVGDPTKYNDLLPVTTNELNSKGHVVIYPEAEVKQVSETVNMNFVLTAGLKEIEDGQLFLIIKYKSIPSGINGGPGFNTTTVL